MRAYNKRLDATSEVVAVDYVSKRVKLVVNGSNPKFYYHESLDNVELQVSTFVMLDGIEIYVGDVVTNGTHKFKVEQVPGGFFPFCVPAKENFKKVE